MYLLLADFKLLGAYPEVTIFYYIACFSLAFWRCKREWAKTWSLAFAISRVPFALLGAAGALTGGPFALDGAELMTVSAILAAVPYVLARPRLRERITGKLVGLASRLSPSLHAARAAASSTVAISARAVQQGTTSTVAAIMALDEQRKLARAARLERQANEGADKEPGSDYDVLVAKYGTFRTGREAVTIYDPERRPKTIWVPRKRQLFGPNTVLWFHAAKTAAFIGFGLYLVMSLPTWLRPVAVAGVAGVELFSFLHFNPLHLLGL